MRSAGLVLGATAPTAATVLACYFAGLGLGAGRARHLQWCPVRLYGLLELGAGLGAFWSLVIFRLLASDLAQTWLTVVGLVGRVAVIAVALLPATFCLGATLPQRSGPSPPTLWGIGAASSTPSISWVVYSEPRHGLRASSRARRECEL
jgi:hypothetical protein